MEDCKGKHSFRQKRTLDLPVKVPRKVRKYIES